MSSTSSTTDCPDCARLRAEVEVLKAQIAELKAALEESRRSGKRQAAPFRKKKKKNPKKPGRKSGKAHGEHAHRKPDSQQGPDEIVTVALPESCPNCRGRNIRSRDIRYQYQTEIPRKPIHRRFDIHVGTCGDCGAAVQGRHRLQTSDALGAAGAQLGPYAHAALSILNKEMGLSHGKCAKVLQRLFGIRIARSTSVRSMLRTARRSVGSYEEIRAIARASPWNVPDETGWRVGGENGWLHVTVSELVTCYRIARSRGHEVLAGVLTKGYRGILIHDGFAGYRCFGEAIHQACLNHMLQRCKELLQSASRGAVRFPRAVRSILKEALELRRRYLGGDVSYHGLQVMRGRLREQMRRLVTPTKSNADNERFAWHLYRNLDHLFTFLLFPHLDATNWRAEQAIRPAVVNRKVWGGNRTYAGARAQEILMSVIVTRHQNGQDPLEFLKDTLCSTAPLSILD